MVRYRKYRTKNHYIYYSLLGLLFLAALYFGLLNWLISGLLFPIQRGFVGTANVVNQFIVKGKDNQELLTRNKDLEEEVLRLTLDVAERELLKQENTLLRQQLNFLEESLQERQAVIGRVIGKNLNNNSILILDKGKREGIEKGLAVIAGGGVMVGKITNVSERRSELTLATDANSFIAGTILNYNKTNNLVIGKFGISLEIDLIPQGEDVKRNDIVVTSGLEENIPRGLVIGQIQEVKSGSGDLFQSAIVEPSIGYENLSLLSILLPN